MLAVLSTAHKLGLGLSGLVFVAFALAAAMLVPRTRPEFPGRRLGWFVFASVLLFAGMMCAVVFFGQEKHPPDKHPSAISARY